MRAGLAFIAVLALSVAPAMAQAKTKAPSAPHGVDALEMCETFASGNILAVDAAIAKGWEAYEDSGESPFVKSYAGNKELAGLGYATMFALVETYPDSTFGYCRVDVTDATSNAAADVQAIKALPRYQGQLITNADGSFASLAGVDDKNRLLLTHATPTEFVIQLSITTPKAATAE